MFRGGRDCFASRLSGVRLPGTPPHGLVAQMAEHSALNRNVEGSSPSRPTKIRLSVRDDKYELTHENTTLYTFLGRTAIGDMPFENASANHVFVHLNQGEEAEKFKLSLDQVKPKDF